MSDVRISEELNNEIIAITAKVRDNDWDVDEFCHDIRKAYSDMTLDTRKGQDEGQAKSELTPVQRQKACSHIKQVVMIEWGRIESTNVHTVEMADGNYAEGYDDAIISLPTHGDRVELQISDKELIKAVKKIKECILYDSGKIGEFLAELGSTDSEK